jgi:hypothetical protein
MNIISKADAKSLGLTRYFSGKPCRHGHIDERSVANGDCISCARNTSKRMYNNNRKKYLNKAKDFYIENRGSKLEYARQYRTENRDQISETKRLIHQRNPEKMRSRVREWKRFNRKNNPEFMMLESMRAMVRRVLESTGSGKENRTVELVGYTPDQLRNHIESQFKPGMSWDNRSEWHIDHIIPMVKMVRAGLTDQSLINGLWNLQPLWKHENLKKSDKL